MDLLTYMPTKDDGYSPEKAMASKMICSQYLLRVKPEVRVVARNECYQNDTSFAFDDALMSELFEHLYSYDDRIYVAENNGEILAFVPSLFCCSSLVIALKFNFDDAVTLCLINQSEHREMFVLSPNIKVKKANMSARVSEQISCFEGFCKRLKAYFLEFGNLNLEYNVDELADEIVEHCFNLSLFAGCPISVSRDGIEGEISTLRNLDFPLLTAFVFNMLLLAKREASDRSARIFFKNLSQTVAIVFEMDAPQDNCLDVLCTWENISSEKLMPFGSYVEDGLLKICFQPYMREISYLGLKQLPQEMFF